MDLILWLFILGVSIAVLVIASDYLLDSSEHIGLAAGLSHFTVGVIIIGIGTSLPELVASLFSVYKGHSEIVIGNVLGSNITNIFLVLGVAGVIVKGFDVKSNLMAMDLPFLTGSALLMAFMIWDSDFKTIEAVVCLVALAVYVCGILGAGSEADEKDTVSDKSSILKNVLILIVSAVCVFVGAKYTVEAVIHISELLSLGTEVIALSAVALGTSLPEVMVSISAARQGKSDMIVGNIIGSNIFNTFGVMGICGLVGHIDIPESIIGFSLPMSVAAAFMYFVITKDQKINRSEGAMLLIFYVFFIGRLFNWI